MTACLVHRTVHPTVTAAPAAAMPGSGWLLPAQLLGLLGVEEEATAVVQALLLVPYLEDIAVSAAPAVVIPGTGHLLPAQLLGLLGVEEEVAVKGMAAALLHRREELARLAAPAELRLPAAMLCLLLVVEVRSPGGEAVLLTLREHGSVAAAPACRRPCFSAVLPGSADAGVVGATV